MDGLTARCSELHVVATFLEDLNPISLEVAIHPDQRPSLSLVPTSKGPLRAVLTIRIYDSAARRREQRSQVRAEARSVLDAYISPTRPLFSSHRRLYTVRRGRLGWLGSRNTDLTARLHAETLPAVAREKRARARGQSCGRPIGLCQFEPYKRLRRHHHKARCCSSRVKAGQEPALDKEYVLFI